MKKFLIVILCCLITLPAFAGSKKVMTRCMESWRGYPIEDVMKVWGAPTGQEEVNGRMLYYWKQSPSYNLGKHYTSSGGTSTCTRIIEVNDYNDVVDWEVQGNQCPTTYFRVKDWVNPNNNPWADENYDRNQKFQNSKIYKIFEDIKEIIFVNSY